MNSTEQTSMWRRWCVPSVGACVWITVFLVLTLSNWRLVLVNADGDPALHWRLGNWMIEHGEIIRTDQFSHTRAGAPVVTQSWLSEIGFAAAGNWLGWNGLVVVAAALIATTLWLLLRQLLAEATDVLLATALVLLAALSCQVHWAARPHLATHLLVVLVAGKLRAFDGNRLSAPKLFAWLVPAMLLWANLHGAFFIGFILIGCYAITEAVAAAGGRGGPGGRAHPPSPRLRQTSRARLQTLVLLLAVCGLVSLLNPNGWKLHAIILECLRHPRFVRGVNEFLSPNFHSPSVHGFVIQMLALGLTLLVVRPRLAAVEILLLAVWGYFALHSLRNIPIFSLMLTPVLAVHLQTFLRETESPWSKSYRRVAADVAAMHRSAGGHLLAGAVVVGVLLVLGISRRPGGPAVPATEPQASRFPVAAVKFLREQPDAVRGRMFSMNDWGSYLTLALPEHKVFIDSRYEFYGADLLKEYTQITAVKPGWTDPLDKHDVSWALLPAGHRLSVMLALHPHWQEIYRDTVAVIFARTPS